MKNDINEGSKILGGNLSIEEIPEGLRNHGGSYKGYIYLPNDDFGLTPEGKWSKVWRSAFTNWMKERNINIRQIANWYITGDPNIEPICHICNKRVRQVINPLIPSRYYSATCDDDDCRYMNISLNSSRTAKSSWSNPNYREAMSKRDYSKSPEHRQKLKDAAIKQWSDPEFRKKWNESLRLRLNSDGLSHAYTMSEKALRQRALTSRENLMKSDAEVLKFYIAYSVDKGSYKIGVTKMSLAGRKWMSITWTGEKYTYIHLLTSGDKEFIANLEFSVKEKNNYSEWFKDFSELKSILREIIKENNDLPI